MAELRVQIMLIDSRDLPRTDDGLPIIAARDLLPLLQLLEAAALSADFTRKEWRHRYEKAKLAEVVAQRDAIALELLLPKEWHFAPVRRHKLPNEPNLSGGRPRIRK